MKPKWVRESSGPIRNVDFYLPDEEYQVLLKAKGKRSWREFALQAAKAGLHAQRSKRGKGDP